MLAIAIAALLPALAWGDDVRPAPAFLEHDPQDVLAAVARRMHIRLQPFVPLPAIHLESRTPLEQLQRVAERQWGTRPREFMNVYVAEENAIYLIDDTGHLAHRHGTLDDALAHELVHYLQANYRKDGFSTEWSEVEALRVQAWFRQTFMAKRLSRNDARFSP